MKSNKIMGLLLILLVIGGCILGYSAVSKERHRLDKVLKLELPMEQAVREVEVSVWETCNAVFYYMITPSAVSSEEYKKQLKDVEEFMARYKALAETDQEKKIITSFEQKWANVVTKAEELISLRNKMTELQQKVCDAVHKADDIIDYKIQAAFVDGVPDLIEKEKAVREVEVSIWETVNTTNYYVYSQSDKPRREFTDHLTNVSEFWDKYKKLNITPAEQPHIKEFENQWAHSVELIKECNALADELRKKYLAFWELVHEADDVIDFEIQEHLKQRISKIEG